ncbi:MAG TPA: hypothetical protein PK867_22770, partial [Pirellulales bacterium]|nr:hypothetical protein [Pirellulales bacterium]
MAASGVDVNAPHKGANYVDMTPLAWAILHKQKPAFKRLLGHGADPQRPYEHYGSLFNALARIEDDSDWLRFALEHNADPNLPVPPPIFGAVESRRKENLELLLNAGANVDPRLASGDTPLLRAAGSFNAFDTVYRLLEAGADHRARNIFGNDLAYVIVEDVRVRPDQELGRWREKVIEWLVNKGVSFRDVERRLEREPSEREQLSRWAKEQEERLARWSAIAPTDARDYRLRGAARRGRRQHDAAIVDFSEAVKLEPDNAATYKLRGDAWYQKGLFAEKAGTGYRQALADYTKAIKLDAKFAEAFV